MISRPRLLGLLRRAMRWAGGDSYGAELALASMPDPAFAIDLEGKVLCWNRPMALLTGVSAEQMIGQGNYAYSIPFYGERRPILIDHYHLPDSQVKVLYPTARRRGETLLARTETKNLNGRYGMLSAVVSPLYDTDGQRIGTIEVVRDETDLYLTQARNETLSLAVEQSPNGTVITNAQSEIQYVNAAFEEMYGYQASEVLGKPMNMLSSGQTPEATVHAMWTTLMAGKAWKGEFINRRKDGEIRNIFCRVSPIRQTDGQVTQYLAIQEDVTERKRIGQELDRHRSSLSEMVVERTAELQRLKQSAESANQAKSAFLANMSHEIRTPMNGIMGLTRMVIQKSHDPQVRGTLERVLETAQGLLTLINDILDLSKIEANKMSLESVDFSVTDVVNHQVDMVRTQAAQKNLALHVEVDLGSNAMVKGDPLRVGQVLLNLLGNAVKFTREGSVRVVVRQVASQPAQESARLIRFEVTDTGVGVSPEVQQRLFKSFEQADHSISRQFGGTGLGLAISRHLVGMMDGEIGVVSEEGKGATFWFTVQLETTANSAVLPMHVEASSDAIEAVLAKFADYVGARLLLVEDNEINQEVALSLLDQTGLVVDVAGNGAEALDMAKGTRYALVLMDMQMPVMDGLTATRHLRAMPGYASTPILAMTANIFDEDRKACLDAGMNGHLPKPIVPMALYEALLSNLPSMVVGAEADITVPEAAPVSAAVSETALVPVVDELAALRDMPGLDLQQGLDSLRGRVPAYMKVLRKFATTQPADGAVLLSAIQKMDTPEGREEARRHAHSLKGVAGTLGLPELQQRAAELEAALKGGAEESAVLALAAKLEPFRQSLARELLKRLPLA